MIDPARLGALFATHAAACAAYARQFGPTVDAEAVVQEAFVRLLGQECEPDHPRAWLLATVRRLAIDALRAGRSRREREHRLASSRGPGEAWFEPDPTAPIDAGRAAELLQALPDRQREAVVLRIWGGLTLHEIAGLLGVGVSTAHDEIAKALATLRRQMEPAHESRRPRND